jgi:hypothetical protein
MFDNEQEAVSEVILTRSYGVAAFQVTHLEVPTTAQNGHLSYL